MKSRKDSSGRRVAWEVLVAVESGGFADAELGRRLAVAALDRRDEALATRLVYGTLAWQGYLDHLIGQCGRPVARIDTPIRCLLRLAFYQLTKLDRVPAFAAVDTAVELSKDFKNGVATGFVNAVLRRFVRDRERLLLPAREADPAGYLSVMLSHPRWLVEMWIDEFGATDSEALLTADNEPAPTVLRVNRTRTDRASVLRAFEAAGVACRPARFSPDGVELLDGTTLASLPGYQDGWFCAQGEASQLVTALLGLVPGMRVLDACAAPGGKATHIAERMGGRGTVVAVDANLQGLTQLNDTAARLGLTCVKTVCADLFDAVREQPAFDAILLDAPCSGLGTLRQHPEIRWRRSAASIVAAADLESRMLDALAGRLRAGGVLVYSTCTLTRRENDDVVNRFLAGHPDFRRGHAEPFLPAEAAALVDAAGILRTFPHRHGLDGFFAVRLERTQPS